MATSPTKSVVKRSLSEDPPAADQPTWSDDEPDVLPAGQRRAKGKKPKKASAEEVAAAMAAATAARIEASMTRPDARDAMSKEMEKRVNNICAVRSAQWYKRANKKLQEDIKEQRAAKMRRVTERRLYELHQAQERVRMLQR